MKNYPISISILLNNKVCDIYVYPVQKGSWYVIDGEKTINFTPQSLYLYEGENLDVINLYSFSCPFAIHSIDELDDAIEGIKHYLKQ